jgi:hypothetical protein
LSLLSKDDTFSISHGRIFITFFLYTAEPSPLNGLQHYVGKYFLVTFNLKKHLTTTNLGYLSVQRSVMGWMTIIRFLAEERFFTSAYGEISLGVKLLSHEAAN